MLYKDQNKTYNQIRSIIELQASQTVKPLVLDNNLQLVIRKHGDLLTPLVLNKLLLKLNPLRLSQLRRIYNKQAIHLITLQMVTILKQEALVRFDNLINLNLLLIPFKVSDLSQTNGNKHQFVLSDKEDQLLPLIQQLPSSKELFYKITTDTDENLDEILQKYDLLVQDLLQNVKRYELLKIRLQKYKRFNEMMISKLDPTRIQEHLITSSNTSIIKQINKSRILTEKVNHQL